MKRRTFGPLFAMFALIAGETTVVESARAEKTGNGGTAVVCRRANDGRILSAEILDLFEARNRYGLRLVAPGASVSEYLNQVRARIAMNPRYAAAFDEESAYVKSHLVVTDREVVLEPTDDVFPVVSKKGCKIEQLANYTPDGKVLLDREIYGSLSAMNRAALLVHETVYAIERKVSESGSSTKSRKLTAYLFADSLESESLREMMNRDVRETLPAPIEGVYLPNEPFCAVRVTVDEKARVLVIKAVSLPDRPCADENDLGQTYAYAEGTEIWKLKRSADTFGGDVNVLPGRAAFQRRQILPGIYRRDVGTVTFTRMK